MTDELAKLEKILETLQITVDELDSAVLDASMLPQKYVVGVSELRVGLESLKGTVVNLAEQLQELIEEDENE